MSTKSVLEEINQQMQKPLEVKLEEFKIAGAKFISALDNYIAQIDNKEDKSNGTK